MTIALSDRLKAAIRKVLDDIEEDGGFLDAYKSARQIQLALPDEKETSKMSLPPCWPDEAPSR
jgi:hypothetical protein